MFGVISVCASDEQFSAEFADYTDEDEEFYDAQEPELSFNEKIARVKAEYPATDEYTGYDRRLDRQRTEIIQKIIDCNSQMYAFPAKRLAFEIDLDRLVKKYHALQEKRIDAKHNKQERKKIVSCDASSLENKDSRHHQFDDWDDSDEDDDFPDYESYTSRTAKSSVRSGMRSKHAPQAHTSYSRSFDW